LEGSEVIQLGRVAAGTEATHIAGRKTICAIADAVSLTLTPGRPSFLARFVPKSVDEKIRPSD
jgi:hypothetical protein